LTASLTGFNHQQGANMSNPIVELTTAQFLGLAALAIAGGVAFGIAIGIKIYARYGRTR
jgi:hypothetical protein